LSETQLHARGFLVLAGDAIGDDRRQWIEVMPTADKARNGPWFFTITAADLEVYADYIRANPDRIAVDYDHAGAEGGSTVAAGWFTGQAEVVEGDNGPRLRAEVEWTPQGAEDVESKRFRFISPEFDFQERDQKTGLLSKAKELIAATLTNRPFFRNLAPVAADAGVVWDATTGYVQRMAEINEALNGDVYPYRYWVMDVGDGKALVCEGDDYWVVPFTVGDDGEAQVAPSSDWMPAEQQWVSAPAEAMRAVADTVISATTVPDDRPESSKAQQPLDDNDGGAAATDQGGEMPDHAIAAALGLPDDATDEEIVTAAKRAKERSDAAKSMRGGGLNLTAELVAALDLDDTADEADVLAAVRRSKVGADRLDELEPEIDSLRAAAAREQKLEHRVKALEAERKMERVDSILADGVRTGRIVPAEKKSLARQFRENPDGLAELISARPEHMFALTTAGGGDVTEGDDIISVKREFDSVEADGVDTDSARLHVRAMQILREQGKHTPTEAEYADAIAAADSAAFNRR
jgi:phage I-like protein